MPARTLVAVLAGAALLPRHDMATPLVQFLDYWRSRSDDDVPHRNTLDPCDLAPLLAHLLMWDVLDDGRYRVRLAGTALCNAAGRELTGLPADQFPWQDTATLCAQFDQVRDRGTLLYVERLLPRDRKPPQRCQHLVTPWRQDTSIRYLLGIIVFI
ncbi:MAG: PAS domain-containing protein [Azospirillaceae bacterium]|nr:PAS domain-containing protein [Azospirillaceae bacterium]